MELLAHVWGSEEAKEGMNAFLAGRAPDFQKFRLRDKKELERYLAGYERDENAPPAMRGNGKAKCNAKDAEDAKEDRKASGRAAPHVAAKRASRVSLAFLRVLRVLRVDAFDG